MNQSLLRMSLGLITLAAISACNSKPTPPTPDAMLAPNMPKVVYLGTSDRTPASAPVESWIPEEIALNITQANQTFPVSVDVKRVQTWQDPEQYTDFVDELQEQSFSGTCYDLVCSAGGGKSALWDAFYSAPKAQKPAALNKAIKGIGDASAAALVKNNYFMNGKPKTWSDFVREINDAADSKIITRTVATTVIDTYRAENAENLGYARNNCREQGRSCTKYREVLVRVPVQRIRIVERRRVTDQRRFDLAVQVTNAKLLSTERELVQFHIDENGAPRERETGGSFNRYTISASSNGGGRVLVNLTGNQRILRGLSSNVVRKDSLQRIGGVPTFTVEVDPAMLPTQEDQGSQLALDYKLMSCELNWLGTGCKGIFSSNYKTLRMETKNLTSPITLIPVELPADEKIWVDYSVRRLNSGFYDANPISQRQSETLQ